MKKHLLTALILGGLVLAAPSCKKDDNTDTTTPTNNYTAPGNAIALTVDGTAMPVDATIVNNTSGSVYIHGSHTGGSATMAVTVPATTTAGTYSPATLGSYALTYSDGSDYFSPNTGAGTIVITANDTDHKVVKGTFSGTVTSLSGTGVSHVITNGSFTANY